MSAGDPIATAVCHCDHCQRQGGGAFSVNLVVHESQLNVSGVLETYEETGERGDAVYVRRRFCGSCGSPIVSELVQSAGVVAVDPVESRRESALKFGATKAISPDELADAKQNVTAGEGFDYVFEVVGKSATARTAYETTQWLIGALAKRNRVLPTGSIIATGTLAPAEPVTAGEYSARFSHDLGEVATVLLDAGLVLTGFAEHDSVPWQALPQMVKGDDGEWRLPEHPERLPLSFTVRARKPGPPPA